jgi:threonine synthase
MRLACSDCGSEAAAVDVVCRACGGLLAFGPADIDGAALASLFDARRASRDPLDTSGVWRYRELLPPIPRAAITTLRENAVPLYDGPLGAAYAGMRAITYLHLGMNPTGSFKDAGMTVAVSRARELGMRAAICASTGNTAAAMAAYCARAGIVAIVLVPAVGISASKVAQTLDYGATVLAVDGDFDAALAVVRRIDAGRVAVVNSINPYRIEGQKTAAFRLLDERGWKAPDWLVVPGGNLGNSSAFGKGFREARDLGLIDRIPRIAVVQASGAAPFARAFRDGGELVPVSAKTNATAIKIGAPASWKKAMAEVRGSQGIVIDVDDDAIADARATIGRDGVGCEPASAATLAGLTQLVANGIIARDADVVLALTGHVLKDTAYSTAFHESHAALANRIVRVRDDDELFARIAAAADAVNA